MLKRTVIHEICVILTVCILIFFNIHTSTIQSVPTSANPESVKLAILMYHGFTESGKESTYVINIKNFEKDIIYLRENGFEFVNTDDLINYVEYGRELPQKSIMITFDDGYLNNFVYAYPIIQKYNVKTVISPIASCSDYNTQNPDSNTSYANMTWNQIEEMSHSGLVNFENHSYNLHSFDQNRKGSSKNPSESSDDYRKLFFEDLLKAHRAIYGATGRHPVAYTYPFGSVSSESKTILKCMNYKISFSCNSGFNTITRDPQSLFMLKRFNRSHDTSASELLKSY